MSRLGEQGDRVREIAPDGLYDGKAAEDQQSPYQAALTGVVAMAVMMIVIMVVIMIMVVIVMMTTVGMTVPGVGLVMALVSHDLSLIWPIFAFQLPSPLPSGKTQPSFGE